MTVEEAHNWLKGIHNEQTYFNEVYGNKLPYKASELPGLLSIGVAAKMRQAICVLEYERMKSSDTAPA